MLLAARPEDILRDRAGDELDQSSSASAPDFLQKQCLIFGGQAFRQCHFGIGHQLRPTFQLFGRQAAGRR
jgi:hypothetical protein